MNIQSPNESVSPPARSSAVGEGIRIAFVSIHDAKSVHANSGTIFNISQGMLRHGVQVEFIGPLSPQVNVINLSRYVINKYIFNLNDFPQRDPGFLLHYARQVERKLSVMDVDLVFGSGTLPLSYLQTDLPVVLWTDCTFANLLNYYPKYCDLSARSIRNGHAADRAMYARCDRALFASKWAVDSAIRDYGLSPDKAFVVPRGANVPGASSSEEAQTLIESRARDRCILLFVGVDWVRKGGAIAAETARIMNKRGIPTELRVIGCRPQRPYLTTDFISYLGRISKSTLEGQKRFVKELSESHFMIMPSRAEAYGIAYLEAAAYGVPSLATRTGGTGYAVTGGVSGLLFEPEDNAEIYASEASRYFTDYALYKELACSAYADYASRSSWDTTVPKAIVIMRDMLNHGKTR